MGSGTMGTVDILFPVAIVPNCVCEFGGPEGMHVRGKTIKYYKNTKKKRKEKKKKKKYQPSHKLGSCVGSLKRCGD